LYDYFLLGIFFKIHFSYANTYDSTRFFFSERTVSGRQILIVNQDE